ncbi:hypothetical protein D3C73_1103370 [compost metagenome]
MTRPPTQPDQALAIHPFERDASATRGVDQRLGRGSQGVAPHEARQGLDGRFRGADLFDAWRSIVAADPVQAFDAAEFDGQKTVAKLQREAARQEGRFLHAIRIKDVIDAGPTAHRARLAATDRRAGEGLQLKRHVFDDMSKPGPCLKAPHEPAGLPVAAAVVAETW